MDRYIDGIPATDLMAHQLWEGTSHEEPQKSTEPHNNQPQPTKRHQGMATPPLERQEQSDKSEDPR